MTVSDSGYAELLDGIWDACYTRGFVGQDQPLLRFEQARRRTVIYHALAEVLPTTTILYTGLSRERSVEPFLGSAAWRDRPARPGAVFPDAGSTAESFAQFLKQEWLPDVDPWAADIVGYEFGLLWAQPGTGGSSGSALRWAPGLWAARSAFDVPEYLPKLRDACREFPWDVAVLTARPRPRPFATLSIPRDGKVLRVHVRDAVCEVLSNLSECPPSVDPAERERIISGARARGLLVSAEEAA